MFNCKISYLLIALLALTACGQSGPSDQDIREMVRNDLMPEKKKQGVEQGYITMDIEVGNRKRVSDSVMDVKVSLITTRADKKWPEKEKQKIEQQAEFLGPDHPAVKMINAEPGEVVQTENVVVVLERWDDGWELGEPPLRQARKLMGN